MTIPHRKKLIEVALPLPEINDASAYDKMPGIGAHPKGIHHWWARLPLPTARAILFSSVVDDPSEHLDRFPTEAAQDAERERLFGVLREMMGKKLHAHPEIYAKARAEMEQSCGGKLPAVLDPFSGGGSIPLEANRLGFEAHASDLNPVAVLLNKCNLELAPRWSGKSPVNLDDRQSLSGTQSWKGMTGLAADLRHYGNVIRTRAVRSLGNIYPKAASTSGALAGGQDVIAWLWTRTVASPNPAAQGKHVPLVSSFVISNKVGREAWVELLKDDAQPNGWKFAFHREKISNEYLPTAKLGTRAGKAKDFVCFLTNTPIPRSYIQAEGKAGRLGIRLLAIVADQKGGKVFLPPNPEQEAAALSTQFCEKISDARATFLNGALPNRAGITGGVCSAYGLYTWGHLFTDRQIAGLVTISDLIGEIGDDVKHDCASAGMSIAEAEDYAKTIKTFLALALDRCASFNNSLCRWNGNQTVFVFTKQSLPMVWDFAECNILGEKAICWHAAVGICADALETLVVSNEGTGFARQEDAAKPASTSPLVLVSTDPPYYNNIGYAALSDFYYVWLRRTVGSIYPDEFSTVLVPKDPELTATPSRFGGDANKAKEHFEDGFRGAFSRVRERLDPRFPLTVYYAFKQEDEEATAVEDEVGDEETAVDLTTGWETLLEALVSSRFQITATWPVRASFKWRALALGSNALASYIVLACRPRPASAQQVSRRDFLAELKRELPAALKHLQQGNVAPVDLAQASIGPGMAVYSRYARILESDGSPMTVRTALTLINQIKEEVLGEPESDYDPETRWALMWFDQHGFEPGDFGDANTLATAHAISVGGMREAGLVEARSGIVRLLPPGALPKNWDPATDDRLTVWEMTHHLIRLHHTEGAGDATTAGLLRKLGNRADAARDLAYRLFSVAERRKRSSDAQGYNALVLGWSELSRLAQETPQTRPAADSELNFN